MLNLFKFLIQILQQHGDKQLTSHPGLLQTNGYEFILDQVSDGASPRVSSEVSQELGNQEGLQQLSTCLVHISAPFPLPCSQAHVVYDEQRPLMGAKLSDLFFYEEDRDGFQILAGELIKCLHNGPLLNRFKSTKPCIIGQLVAVTFSHSKASYSFHFKLFCYKVEGGGDSWLRTPSV